MFFDSHPNCNNTTDMSNATTTVHNNHTNLNLDSSKMDTTTMTNTKSNTSSTNQ